jgi:hypothetical protein
MAAMTPEMMAQMIAAMQANMAAVAQPAVQPAVQQPPAQPQGQPNYPPPPMGGQGGYAAPPPVTAPQGTITPQGSQAVDDDWVGDLPPADLPVGTYDAEVLYIETKGGETEKGPWENYRYRFTVLAGQFAGKFITYSLSKIYPRPLYSLFEACGRPIVKDANGRVGFRKSAVNGCRVNMTVTEGKDGYLRVGQFKAIATQAQPQGGYALPPNYGAK